MDLYSINEIMYPDERYRGVKRIEVPPYDIILFDIPRFKITNFVNENQMLFLNKSVVYILFNKELTANSQREVYIGKSSNFLNRKSNHLENKQFWTNALIFSSNYFNESAITYLENKITNIARRNNSLDVKTMTTQSSGQIRMQDQIVYDQFASIMTELLQRQRYWTSGDESDSIESFKTFDTTNCDVFYITRKSAFDDPQPMYVSGDQFIVKKGTKISKKVHNSIQRPYGKLNQDLVEQGVISRQDGEFLQDYAFDSPSAAACIIVGGSVSGPKEWKNKNGTSLGKIAEKLV